MTLQSGLIELLYATAPKAAAPYIYLGLILVTIAAGYLLGSINSAIIFSRLLYRDDIRKYGSGNAGLTNMLRTYGVGTALLTLAGDVLKTALSVFIGGLLFGFHYIGAISTAPECYVAGFFAVVGHVFPAYFKMKGGKGVLAFVTMGAILSPIIMGILLLLFAAVVALSRYVSLGSVSMAVLYPVFVFGYFKVVFSGLTPNGIISLVSVLLACLIVFRHTENLQRISDRTERKLSFGKRKK